MPYINDCQSETRLVCRAVASQPSFQLVRAAGPARVTRLPVSSAGGSYTAGSLRMPADSAAITPTGSNQDRRTLLDNGPSAEMTERRRTPSRGHIGPSDRPTQFHSPSPQSQAG